MENYYRVLIVEDDPFIRKVLQHSLKTDFEIIIQANGVEAMSWLDRGNLVDIVLTDLHMPYMNGLELIQVMRASTLFRQIPVIMLSSASDSTTRVACLEQGADDFVTKPFSPVEIRAKIMAHLRRSAPNGATSTATVNKRASM